MVCAFINQGLEKFAIARTRSPPREPPALPGLKQLIGINVDRDGHVFREWKFVDSLTHKATQANDGFASDQNVETELAL